jgi:imidazolonepropionase-like amidohydrolase
MAHSTRFVVVSLAAVLITPLTWSPVGARSQIASGVAYAIRGARIVTVSGAVIDKGTVVMRNGLIEDAGATVNAPADAVVIDGTNLTVYPGLIDMANTAVVEMPATEVPAQPAAGAAQPGRGGGRGAGAAESYADVERTRRDNILNPDFEAARYVRTGGPELQRLATAGITSVLAVPAAGLFRGQSALINTAAPAEAPEISSVAGDRRGLVVVRSGVAEHIAFTAGRGGGGGGGYPGSLLGVMAFIRQSFYDAQWQREARAYGERHKDAPRQAFESSLDALAPALEGRMPVAFEANQEREILRALDFAKEFKLDPIIVGGTEAAPIIEDLKAAKARVICSVATGGAGRAGGAGRGGGGRGGASSAAAQDAPKVAALLDKAGILFAFTSEGLPAPGDLVRGVGRVIRDGGLSPEAALRGLTSNAAKLAGVGDRLGTVEKGRIANVIVTDGDLFSDQTHIRHVFVDGRPVDLDAPVAPVTPAGRGRGGH